jgi:hypothetical protein
MLAEAASVSSLVNLVVPTMDHSACEAHEKPLCRCTSNCRRIP